MDLNETIFDIFYEGFDDDEIALFLLNENMWILVDHFESLNTTLNILGIQSKYCDCDWRICTLQCARSTIATPSILRRGH